MNFIKKALAAGGLALALSTAAPTPAKAQQTLALGLSTPCHGLLALRAVWDWNEHVGMQTDIGLGFTSLDLRLKKQPFSWLNGYLYAGAIGISPWIYGLTNQPVDGPTVGADLGVGLEIGGKSGIAVGIEGGAVIPIPPEKNTQAFRVDLNLMYRIPL